jgi:putative membrane protein
VATSDHNRRLPTPGESDNLGSAGRSLAGYWFNTHQLAQTRNRGCNVGRGQAGFGGLNLVSWVLIILYVIDPVLTDAFPRALASSLSTPIAVLLPMAFALIHGAQRYGWSGILVFLVLCLGISNIMENLGVITGFPFGHYHYTDVLGPKLFEVPLLIGPGYFGTGYVSWVLANILLKGDLRGGLTATIAVPVVATFIMVAWDVGIDPGSSTVAKIWIWEKGGGYFGVPFTNYLGWYLTVFLFMFAFALYDARRIAPLSVLPKAHWYQATILYAVIAMDLVASYVGAQNGPTTDATGKVWQTGDLFETAAIMGLFVMLPFAAASYVTLLLRREPGPAER